MMVAISMPYAKTRRIGRMMVPDRQGDDCWSRRALLGSGAAAMGALVAGCSGSGATPRSVPVPTPSPTPAAVPSPGLNAVAAARGMRFGSAFAWSAAGADAGSFANPNYAALLQGECGVLVPENEMKWQALRPSATEFRFDRFDAMVDYARVNGLALRGHTLLWHSERWFPAWLNAYDFGASPAAEAERLVMEHIRTVTTRYGTRIGSYDVVNEAVDNSTGAMRETSLSRAMGSAEAVLDVAFNAARRHAPHAELVYNDFMSLEPRNERHREGVLRLLQGFRARGTPVDALGVQSHLGIDGNTDVAALVAAQTPAWRAFLDAVTGMGYRLVITELDVRDRGLPADNAVRDAAVAGLTRSYLDLMLSYPQLTDVLAWGMSDRYTWLRGFEVKPGDLPARALPYDDGFRAKPMRTAIAEAFAAAPARPAQPA
jgi:endo-1,4-beta-xylanase